MISNFLNTSASKFIVKVLIFCFVLMQSEFVLANQNTTSQVPLQQNTPEIKSEEGKIFKPGDGLYIATPDSSSFLNNVFPINDQGLVDFPIIGKVRIVDMTKPELITYIQTNFREYLRFPNIYIKPVIRVSLLGGFRKTGLFYVDEDYSLWEIIRSVGGPVTEDGLKDLVWERDRDELRGDLIPYLQAGTSLKAMGVKSGDQIWTPSPATEDIWDIIRQNVMPIASFAITMFTLYVSYQRSNQLGYR